MPPDLHDGLRVAAPVFVGLQGPPLQMLRAAVDGGAFPRTTSVLIVKDGRLVFEKYFAGGGRDTLNDTRSAMKSVTALAVGAAIADGDLGGVSEPAFARLADLAPFALDGLLKQGIRLDDLLTMSSALDCDDWDEQSPGNEENMYPRARGCVRHAAHSPAAWHRADGMAALADRRGDDGWRSLRLRSRDLAKLGLLVLAGGRWDGRQVVPADWIARSLMVERTIDQEQSLGFLFWRRVYHSACGPVTGWYMSGNGGNHVVMVPDRNLVVVVTRRHYDSRVCTSRRWP